MLKQIPGRISRLPKALNVTKQRCSFSQLTESTAAETSVPRRTEPGKEESLVNMRFKFPDFVPNPDIRVRNSLREKLEREDMVNRRKVLNIPEFYVGSILAVTTSDIHAPNKSTRFLGICICRSGYGLSSKFILRNVIEHEGVEVIYSLYSPTIQKIELIQLEKRLDDPLFYLRDAPLEYSTFPMDMDAQYIDPNAEVPINTIQIPLNPRPWLQRYERMNLKGAILPELSEKIMKNAKKVEKPWEKYDLMDIYRKTVPEEEQNSIFSEVGKTLKELEIRQKTDKRKGEFVQTPRQTLF